MGTTVVIPLSLKEAISRQEQAYDVWIDGWGTRIAAWNGPTFLADDSYPPFNEAGLGDSLAGIAIGPESDVDRVWIVTNPSKNIANIANATFLIREVSVEQPLLFSQPAKIDRPLVAITAPALPTAQDAASNGVLYVVADLPRNGAGYRVTSTEVPPSYLKADFTVEDLNVVPPAINIRFAPPRLQLRLLLQPNVVTQTKRSSALWGVVNPAESLAIATGAERLVAQWPMFGRKHVEVNMRCDQLNALTGQVTFRVAKLRTLNYDATNVNEETIGLKTITADAGGNAAASFSFCNPGASYLILYATPTNNARMRQWSATMED